MISLPIEIKQKQTTNKNVGVFEIEGLHPNYGITIGNTLRRVLLSSIEGAAVTAIKIKGAAHEFSEIDGVLESVLDIVLNIKMLRAKIFTDEPQTLTLSAKGEKEIFASSFDKNPNVEIQNKDLHIATLTDKKAELEIELTIEKGTGYRTLEEAKNDKTPIGTILVDSAFSPVTRVKIDSEDMRLKGRVDYNRLIVEIETDGSITPKDAFEEATNILAQHFAWISDELSGKDKTKDTETGIVGSAIEFDAETKIEDLPLPKRVINCLVENNVKTLGKLLKQKETDVESFNGLGDKSFGELKEFLEKQGLALK